MQLFGFGACILTHKNIVPPIVSLYLIFLKSGGCVQQLMNIGHEMYQPDTVIGLQIALVVNFSVSRNNAIYVLALGVGGSTRVVLSGENGMSMKCHYLCCSLSAYLMLRAASGHLQAMLRIGRDDEGPWLDRQQVVFPHEPHHPVMVHQHPAATEFCRDAPVTIPTPVRDSDSLNGRPHLHVFCHRLVCLQRPVESRSAHLGN
jgi:hypothetical protein